MTGFFVNSPYSVPRIIMLSAEDHYDSSWGFLCWSMKIIMLIAADYFVDSLPRIIIYSYNWGLFCWMLNIIHADSYTCWLLRIIHANSWGLFKLTAEDYSCRQLRGFHPDRFCADSWCWSFRIHVLWQLRFHVCQNLKIHALWWLTVWTHAYLQLRNLYYSVLIWITDTYSCLPRRTYAC